MRRLLRILLNAATVLSLVLCLATVAAWVRSYQEEDGLKWSLGNPRVELRILTYGGGVSARVFTPVGSIDAYSFKPGQVTQTLIADFEKLTRAGTAKAA